MRILAAVLSDLVAHAREEAPRECCGLLVSTGDTIVQNVRTTNIDPSPTRYRVDPREHFALIRVLRGSTRQIAGAYHSHPHGDAAPSTTDLAEAFDPELLYVIVSLAAEEGGEVRGFRLRSGTVTEVPLLVVS